LAGAVVAGHVIECGTQATGGNYSFFTEVPGMERVGFPWADIAEDGSSVIGKHDGTGGEVSIGTVTSQLLYEIGGPKYLGPDVTSRFDTIQLDQVEKDRVRMHGIKGEPPPSTLKVCLNRQGGFRLDMNTCLTGLDIEAKAKLLEDAFWVACPYAPEDYDAVEARVVRTDKDDPASNEEATAFFKLTLKSSDQEKVGREVWNSIVELGLATIPGYTAVGGATGKSFGVYEPARIAAVHVPQEVVIVAGETHEVSSVIPDATVDVEPAAGPQALAPSGPTRRAPIGAVAGARSGDKGGDANLGLFVRSDEAWAWLDAFLTTEKLRELLPEAAELKIDRHPLPAIRSVNFVLHGLLGEGVASSTRQDGQAKSLGEWLRARQVDVPEALLS